MIKINYEIRPDTIFIFLDEFKGNDGKSSKLGSKLKISEENNKEDLLKAWLRQVSRHLTLEAQNRTNVEVEKLTDDAISAIVLEYLYPVEERLKDVKEILRMLECQKHDYNERNYGDAGNWDRHIRMAQEKFEERSDESPYDFLSSFIKKYQKD